MAVQFQGRYQAIGNEAGIVSVVDSMEGDHAAVQLWRSPVAMSIGHLTWSYDGNYLACTELTGKVVVKRVQFENGSWTVAHIFDVRLEVSSEGIQHVLLNNDGSYLLVKNGSSVTVWPLTHPSNAKVSGISIKSADTKWIKHPTDETLLLAFNPTCVRLYTWDKLLEVAVFELSGLSNLSVGAPEIRNLNHRHKEGLQIHHILTGVMATHFLIDAVITTDETHSHITSLLETSSITPSLHSSTITPNPLPAEIQHQIEMPLGILSKQRLIFLDKEYWICSWRLDATPSIEGVQRLYFLPKDWLNVDCVELCALLADGKILMPNNGELAVIRSSEIGHW